MLFRNRQDAGRQLAERLISLKDERNVIVLGIPRGGVVVAAEIARALDAPLDVFIAHKIGAPGNPEFAIGAITSTGEVWLDEPVIQALQINREEIAREVDRRRVQVGHQLAIFRSSRAPLDVKGKIAILADDGIATGSTVFAAVRALKKQHPTQLILTIPVGPAETIVELQKECDQVIALATPTPFGAVGRFYEQFEQTEDNEVIRLLLTASERTTQPKI